MSQRDRLTLAMLLFADMAPEAFMRALTRAEEEPLELEAAAEKWRSERLC